MNSPAFPGTYLVTVAACLATTALAWPLTAWIDPANLVMLFLLAVFLIALRLGRGPALLAAFLNVFLFDFFCVPPLLTLAVADAQYLITFFVMLVVAVITGHMTAHLGQQALESRDRERRTRALYEMARELAGSITVEKLAETTRRFLTQVVQIESNLLLPGPRNQLRVVGARQSDQDDMSLPRRAFERGEPVEKLGPSGRGACTLFLPMTAAMQVRGVLEVAADAETLHQERPLLNTVASLAGIAAERLHYAEVAQATQVAMASERLRNTVLASLSHDLRTPLTSLVGLTDTLVLARLASPHDETARALSDQTKALAGMVNNLLDLARLAAGADMAPRKEWQELEEVVGSAIRQLGGALDDHAIEIDLAADLPLLEFDAVLLERVFANLLDNAAKHAPPATVIRIVARRLADRVEIAVLNAGQGFPAGLDLTMPFARSGLRPGSGLGLAIAKAIVEVHGGHLMLDNPAGGGARVRFDLPVGNPPVLADESA